MGEPARKPRDRSPQKRRTRRAILDAAVTLMRQGQSPSAIAVAELAEVSRRTVYLYFPTQEQLLTEAALETARAQIEGAIDLAEAGDAEGRLDAVALATMRSGVENEVSLRTMVRLTIEQRLDQRRRGEPENAPLRGRRRIDWIEEALAPVRQQLGDAHYQRLVSALAMCIGFEALLVLRDIRGLDPAEAEQVSSWAARVLLRASLDEPD